MYIKHLHNVSGADGAICLQNMHRSANDKGVSASTYLKASSMFCPDVPSMLCDLVISILMLIMAYLYLHNIIHLGPIWVCDHMKILHCMGSWE